MNRRTSFGALTAAFLLAAAVSACGGGGGGGNSALPATSGGGGGSNGNAAPAAPGNPAAANPAATATPTNPGFAPPPPVGTTPAPGSTAPALQGQMQLATGGTATANANTFTYGVEAGGSSVVFSCGCTSQAGASLLDAQGKFNIPQTAPATPSAPQPTYTTVPGRNYLIIATASNHAEAWQMEFLGSTPTRNLTLGTNSVSDPYTAAAALYVFFVSAGNSSLAGSETAFDGWNFNAISAWVTKLHTGANAQEIQLLNDIAAAQQAGSTLYPASPAWNAAQPLNYTIQNDLAAVQSSGDTALPTPCPGSACTATPTP